jgi:riboflavin biosynthesis pyrimidine reductase
MWRGSIWVIPMTYTGQTDSCFYDELRTTNVTKTPKLLSTAYDDRIALTSVSNVERNHQTPLLVLLLYSTAQSGAVVELGMRCLATMKLMRYGGTCVFTLLATTTVPPAFGYNWLPKTVGFQQCHHILHRESPNWMLDSLAQSQPQQRQRRAGRQWGNRQRRLGLSQRSDSHDKKNEEITGVTLKLAFDSAWGVADLSEHKSERFTCDASLDMVHRLRRDSHAVLVGRNTVERDSCTLTVRRGVELKPDLEHPVRVILDPNLSLDLTKYRIFQDGLRTLVFHCNPDHAGVRSTDSSSSSTGPAGETTTITLKEFPDVSLIYLPPTAMVTSEVTTTTRTSNSSRPRLSPRAVIQHLAQAYHIHHVMVEGGPQTARLFLEEEPNLVDRAILVFAPFCFKLPLASNMDRATFQDAGLELVYESQQGVDRVEHWSRRTLPWPMSDSTTSSTPWP